MACHPSSLGYPSLGGEVGTAQRVTGTKSKGFRHTTFRALCPTISFHSKQSFRRPRCDADRGKFVKPHFSCQTLQNLPTPHLQINPSHQQRPLAPVAHPTPFFAFEINPFCLFDARSVIFTPWIHTRAFYHGYKGAKTLLKCPKPPWRAP